MKRKHCDKPCKECPFRRASLSGYLGASTPQDFIYTTLTDYPMPCHRTIDYSDEEWESKWEAGRIGKLCAGALIFFSNTLKLSRDPDRPKLPVDRTLIFASINEFLDHHLSHSSYQPKEDNGRRGGPGVRGRRRRQ